MPIHSTFDAVANRSPFLADAGTDGSVGVFFQPRSVAVIGATERPQHVGRALVANLLSTPFGGTVYPVNPKRESVLGLRCYPSIGAISEPVDLAVIATPAMIVPAVVRECAESGVRGAIIVSAGFRETGPAGRDLEEEVREAARHSSMRILGPNCLGVMCPVTGLNATFAPAMARKGTVALVSQSGAICTALLDWSLREQIGFSALVSVGSMLDVGWGALIDYLGSDPHTKSIVIYMESVGEARSFLSAARETALDKPILVLKAGRTNDAAQAVASHTGALAGSDAVLDAALRRVGVLRLENVGDIFQITEVLARQPRPAGPRLGIITNAGGPGILATDALLEGGGKLAVFAPETLEALDRVLPPHWSHGNPVDLIGDAGPDRYEQALQIASQDPHTDGLLVILTPQEMSDPTETARRISSLPGCTRKSVLANWMGGLSIAEGETILRQAGIPAFAFPDEAVRAFCSLWRYSDNLRSLYETPESTVHDPSAAAQAADLLASVQGQGRTLLTEWESKQVLAHYGIPTVETHVAGTEEEAVEAAQAIGFPVVVKLYSYTLTHKTDVGGVKLSLSSTEAVRAAFREIQAAVTEKAGLQHFVGVTVQPMIAREGYELIVGATTDPQFGPVLLFGAGGQLVKIWEDHALALPPLNTTLARRLLEQTKVFKALGGVRGRSPVDLCALERLLVRFSELIVEQPAI